MYSKWEALQLQTRRRLLEDFADAAKYISVSRLTNQYWNRIEFIRIFSCQINQTNFKNTNLSEGEALVKDVIQHNAMERGFLQEEVHANGCVVTDVELSDLKETTTVRQATYWSL